MPKVSQGPKSEAAWKAENDFRALTDAEEVMADRRRLTAAKKAGKKAVKEAQRALKVKQKIAGRR